MLVCFYHCPFVLAINKHYFEVTDQTAKDTKQLIPEDPPLSNDPQETTSVTSPDEMYRLRVTVLLCRHTQDGIGAVMSTRSRCCSVDTVGMVANLPHVALLAVTMGKIHFHSFSDYQGGGTHKILSF